MPLLLLRKMNFVASWNGRREFVPEVGKETPFLHNSIQSRKHGRPRPALMGMIKSNQEKLVLKCTSTALKNLPRVTTTQTKPEEFPKQSMDDLNPLRGVGPATASLILSIATTNAKGQEHERVQVPFFSDDTYLWLCVGEVPESSASSETVRDIRGGGTVKGPGSKFVKPSGELNLKYNVKEYRELWDACFELQGRLGADGTGSTISMADIEKVAYVLRNIAFSGYYSAIDAGEILGMTGEQVDDLLVRLDGDAGDGDASSLKNEGETKEEGNSDKKKAKMA